LRANNSHPEITGKGVYTNLYKQTLYQEKKT
jgi:hypothetical protein